MLARRHTLVLVAPAAFKDTHGPRQGDEACATGVSGAERGAYVLECPVADGGFFFQAEDGIRDLPVTGVQTCALPIPRPPPTACTCIPNRVRVRVTCAPAARSRTRSGATGRPRSRPSASHAIAAGARPTLRSV